MDNDGWMEVIIISKKKIIALPLVDANTENKIKTNNR